LNGNLLPRLATPPPTPPLPRTARVEWEPRGVDSGFFNAVAAKACSAAKTNQIMNLIFVLFTILLSTFDTCSITNICFFSKC
jgi:hypothetical protein